MVCGMCGRTLERQEGRAWLPEGGHVDLCHPDDPSLPDCYSEWSWAQAFVSDVVAKYFGDES